MCLDSDVQLDMLSDPMTETHSGEMLELRTMEAKLVSRSDLETVGRLEQEMVV